MVLISLNPAITSVSLAPPISVKFLKVITGIPLTDHHLPEHRNTNFIRDLEQTTGPPSIDDQLKLSKSMNFKYCQAVGELLFAAVTCRPDILFSVIKLNQYSNNPAKIHYQAVKHIFKYHIFVIQSMMDYIFGDLLHAMIYLTFLYHLFHATTTSANFLNILHLSHMALLTLIGVVTLDIDALFLVWPFSL